MKALKFISEFSLFTLFYLAWAFVVTFIIITIMNWVDPSTHQTLFEVIKSELHYLSRN